MCSVLVRQRSSGRVKIGLEELDGNRHFFPPELYIDFFEHLLLLNKLLLAAVGT